MPAVLVRRQALPTDTAFARARAHGRDRGPIGSRAGAGYNRDAMRARQNRARLGVRAAALALALWLPAGPLLSSAAAATRAKPQCKGHGSPAVAAEAAHGTAAHVAAVHSSGGRKADCHAPARKVGCHGSSSRIGCHGAQSGVEDGRKRSCCCAQLAIAASRCGCRHDGGGTAVTVKNALPKPAFHVGAPAGLTASPLLPIQDPDAALRQPPDPPPRRLEAPSFS